MNDSVSSFRESTLAMVAWCGFGVPLCGEATGEENFLSGGPLAAEEE